MALKDKKGTCGEPHTTVCERLAKTEQAMTDAIKGFNDKLDATNTKIDTLDGKVMVLDDKVDGMGSRLAVMESRMESLAAERADESKEAKAYRRGFIACMVLGIITFAAGVAMWILSATECTSDPVIFIGMPDFAWAMIAGVVIAVGGPTLINKITGAVIKKKA